MRRCRCSGQPLPWLAPDAHPDGHECAKCSATLHHGFPNAAHQLPTPDHCSRSSPETGKGAEERPGRHAHGTTHHKAHLHAVEAAWLRLSVRTHGPAPRDDAGFGPPHLTSLAASVAQLCVSHGKRGGGRSWPEESLPELQPLRLVGSATRTMLLRAAWRRAALAATAAPGPRSAAPTQGLRLRVADHAPQSAVPSDTAAAPESVLRPLYMDVQATTPLDPRVLDAMLPYLVNYYGNPHSRTHAYGWESEAAMERARQQVASLIGADPREIIFTSGATESNNIAIKGVARFYRSRKKHVVTTQTEHKCVLDSCRSLEAEGFQVTYLPVQKSGIIDLKELEAAIQPDTSLVSVMTVNNEIGVKQPIAEIGQICSSRKVYFHTDAAQAVGKIPLDVNDMKIDLMSISGHKIYGPKGVGAIYIRRRPRVRVEALQSGGGQERGMRSGTVPTPLVVGLGAACEVAQQEMEYDHKRISKLSERLIQKIMKSLPDVVMNGDPEHHYPGCVNLSFAYVEGESLLMALKDVALSSGSACTSASLEPSYVLRAIGTDEDLAHSSVRFGIGRFTTEEEVDYTAEKCIQHVKRLREMSPLWEMVQDGIDLKSIKWTQH
uniref:Cysteine desulfurase n=1 Tax=Prolemur simus TaxID=1328070 RepID=A0A8C8YMZ5_PROSS